MGRPRKRPREWTTDEAIRKLFPRRVVTQLKREAEKAKKPGENPITKRDSTD